MDILRGKETEKVAQYAHNALSTFGIGADIAETQWRGVLRQLIAKNMVRVDSEAFSTLQLLPDARGVLRGEVSLMLREQGMGSGAERKKRSSKGSKNTKTSVKGMAEASLNAGALERLAKLQDWRAEVARLETERAQWEANVAASEAARLRYERERAAWAAEVAACERSPRTCGTSTPKG
jgi:ATP-dependent DNA helicase RecQ